ncbi:MAG: dihydropteroate synthase [Kineosporiaceae bacterium]
MDVVAGLPAALAAPSRCLVMGVVNVTPDSFSDGGLWLDAAAAVAHGLALVEQGADLLDVGGESTRPGARRVDEAEERRRVLPVVTALCREGVAVSVDTMRPEVARAAVDAGACLVNDVSGGLADPRMPAAVAASGAAYVAMHWRGHADRMGDLATYDDVVADVTTELSVRLDALEDAGLARERVVLDPGLGFAKDAGHNWRLLEAIGRGQGPLTLGRPVLVGASRKRFLGSLLAGADGAPRPVGERDAATAATTTLAALGGAWAVRVHDVAASADAVRVVRAVHEARAQQVSA